MRKAGLVAIFLIAMFVLGSVPPSFGEIEHTSEILHHPNSSQTITPPLIPSNNSHLLTGWSGHLEPLPNYDYIKVDEFGNRYIAGTFQNSINLGSLSATLGSGLTGIFVAKQNFSGHWEYLANNTPISYSNIYDMDLTQDGEIVITGRVSTLNYGTVYFGPNASITGKGASAFGAMIDNSGSWIWAKKLGSTSHELGRGASLIHNSTDNSTIFYSDLCSKHNSPRVCSLNVMKIDDNGTDYGSVSIFSGWDSNPYASTLIVDRQNHIYLSGTISSSNQVSCGSTGITTTNGAEVFLVKIDVSWETQQTNIATYSCEWIKISQSSPANTISNIVYSNAGEIVLDDYGNIMMLGSTSANMTFAGHFFSGNYPSYSQFLMKFYSNGTSHNDSLNLTAGDGSKIRLNGLIYNGSGKFVISGGYDNSITNLEIFLHTSANNSSISVNSFPSFSRSCSKTYSQFAVVISLNLTIQSTLLVNPCSSFGYHKPGLEMLSSGDVIMTIGHYSNPFSTATIPYNNGTITINNSAYRVPVVIRIDARDFDSDGLNNEYDHCAMGEIGWIRTNQTDLDQDGCRDSGLQNNGQGEDTDDDNDGVPDPSTQHPTNFGLADRCPRNYLNWTSTASNDRDGDGCRDSDEDTDYDDDGVLNSMDDCPNGSMYWINRTSYDHDSDGCADFAVSLSYINTWPNLYFYYPEEDFDDDNDALLDTQDSCRRGVVNWTRTNLNDYDNDGCMDTVEDSDDDSDSIPDFHDLCPTGLLNWTSNSNLDFDSDGCHDNAEDDDDDNDQIADTADACPKGDTLWVSDNSTDYDVDGCKDDTEDMDDDGDGVSDSMDSCPKGVLNWVIQGDDYDDDGCRDSDEDSDDDNDGVLDQYDSCLFGDLDWIADVNTDHDLDGCYDYGEDLDDDNDGFQDDVDNCPRGVIAWWGLKSDYDGDGCADLDEDLDDDNDGISDNEDDCKKGVLNWKSNASTDHDEDGCNDLEYEDQDDDDDGISDLWDDCPRGVIAWSSSPSTDHDGDGCKDSDEDFDDDNDGISDTNDLCHYGELNWVSSKVYTDYDEDGCKDLTEDLDDDNDGISDTNDLCQTGELPWLSTSLSDHDSDGCKDGSEDDDDDNDGILDLFDYCKTGEKNWDSVTSTDHDKDGCLDSVEDDDDDNDQIADTMDDCNLGRLNWISNNTSDYDRDGCRDADEDIDDDNDGVLDQFPDQCSKGLIGWVSNNFTDYDGDGCRDVEEDDDDDGDTVVDSEDECIMGLKDWLSSEVTDNDGDGCEDNIEDSDDDNDGLSDMLDECSAGEIDWLSKSTTDYDSDGCRDEGEDTDDDNDAVIDGDDICPKGYLGWVSSTALDYDSDGCHDTNEDSDDDNDGVLDAIELQEGTDPYDANSVPIESFSIQIGGVELSTWDLIGITTGLLSAGYLSFAFFTRNSRYERYLSEINSKGEIDIKKLGKKLENASFFRLISPRQSIKLEDQLNSVIHKTKAEQQSNVEIDVKETAKKESAVGTKPILSLTGVIGDDGYEWLEYPEKSGKHYFRIPGEGPWEKWE